LPSRDSATPIVPFPFAVRSRGRATGPDRSTTQASSVSVPSKFASRRVPSAENATAVRPSSSFVAATWVSWRAPLPSGSIDHSSYSGPDAPRIVSRVKTMSRGPHSGNSLKPSSVSRSSWRPSGSATNTFTADEFSGERSKTSRSPEWGAKLAAVTCPVAIVLELPVRVSTTTRRSNSTTARYRESGDQASGSGGLPVACNSVRTRCEVVLYSTTS